MKKRYYLSSLPLVAICLANVFSVKPLRRSFEAIIPPMGDSSDVPEGENDGAAGDRVHPLPEIEFDMVTYFQNLLDYSPMNSKDSCGYVSLIQYLSYYDTFVNDSIIPEAYDRHYEEALSYNSAISKSPGVLRQAYPTTSLELYSFIVANCETDFQAALMQVVNQAHNHAPAYYSSQTDVANYNTMLDYLFPNQGIQMTGLDYDYLYGEHGIDLFGSFFQNCIANYVKGQIDLGRPVLLQILGGYDSSTSTFQHNHGVVAYYYDNDGIHYNSGWSSYADADRVFPDSSFQYIWRAGIVDFGESFPHVHSNNYAIANDYYCGCGHLTHTHAFYYTNYNSSNHRKQCSCGIDEIEPHIYEAMEDHCYVCGY